MYIIAKIEDNGYLEWISHNGHVWALSLQGWRRLLLQDCHATASEAHEPRTSASGSSLGSQASTSPSRSSFQAWMESSNEHENGKIYQKPFFQSYLMLQNWAWMRTDMLTQKPRAKKAGWTRKLNYWGGRWEIVWVKRESRRLYSSPVRLWPINSRPAKSGLADGQQTEHVGSQILNITALLDPLFSFTFTLSFLHPQ